MTLTTEDLSKSRAIFENIRWRNFLSTGAVFTEINLNTNAATLIVGRNGAGKSTFLDALTFALFGKPFRKINKPTLVNSVNGRDCLVELNMRIGKRNYLIRRGIKPAIFEIFCDGFLINQNAAAKDYQDHLEKFILKMNFKSFTQIIVLGSSTFIPFMQLNAADRRAIIEDLIDIQIFTSMNMVVKTRLQENKDEMQRIRHERDMIELKVDNVRKVISGMQKNTQDKIDINKAEIDRNMAEIDRLMQLVHDDLAMSEELYAQYDNGNNESMSSRADVLIKLQSRVSANMHKIEKDMKFFHANSVCPTCHQDIDESFKDKILTQHDAKLETLCEGHKEINDELMKVNKKLEENRELLEDIKNVEKSITRTNASIAGVQVFIDRLQKENEQLANANTDTLPYEKELAVHLQEQKKYESLYEHHLTLDHYLKVTSHLLKDSGIKTKIVKQYLPIINKLINKYLSSMDFFVNFNLDENFNETILSRYRDDFSYENFSEGEKKKIDLALLFTWRMIARMKNSVSTNLLVLDEIFDSSLDSQATEELYKILNALSSDTSVFVVSHRDDILFDKFKDVIRFEKINNFSRIVN